MAHFMPPGNQDKPHPCATPTCHTPTDLDVDGPLHAPREPEGAAGDGVLHVAQHKQVKEEPAGRLDQLVVALPLLVVHRLLPSKYKQVKPVYGTTSKKRTLQREDNLSTEDQSVLYSEVPLYHQYSGTHILNLRPPLKSGHLSNQDTSNQDTSLIRTWSPKSVHLRPYLNFEL